MNDDYGTLNLEAKMGAGTTTTAQKKGGNKKGEGAAEKTKKQAEQ